MNNLEICLTDIIQKAVKEAIREEISELKDVLRSQQKFSKYSKNPPPKPQKQNSKLNIIRPSELTEILSIATSTLYRMMEKGDLPPKIKISSRAVGWLESDIEDWLETRKLRGTKNENMDELS